MSKERFDIGAVMEGTGTTSSMPGRLVFSTTSANSITPTERMRIDSNGAVGIGITPTQTSGLEVSGTVSATRFVGDGSGRDATGNLTANSGYSVSNSVIVAGSAAGVQSWMTAQGGGFYTPGVVYSGGKVYANGLDMGSTVNSYVWLGGGQISGDGSVGQKYLTISTSNTEAMRIVSTGYVGIGTSAPANPLDVSMSSANLVRLGNSSQNINLGAFSVVNSSRNLAVRSANDLNLQSGGSTSTKMVIQAGGNVGIGTGSPNANLEVSGTVSATNIYTSGTVRVGGTGNESCSTPADFGKNRYNPVTGHMQVCVNR